MATDQSEPRTKFIIGMAVLSIGTLLALRVGFQVYFQMIAGDEEQYKVRNYRSGLLAELREQSNEQLTSRGIDRAMSLVARGARPGPIAPQPSTDLDPLRGWGDEHYMRVHGPAHQGLPPAGPQAAPAAGGGAASPQTAGAPQGNGVGSPNAPAGGPQGVAVPAGSGAIPANAQAVPGGQGSAWNAGAPAPSPAVGGPAAAGAVTPTPPGNAPTQPGGAPSANPTIAPVPAATPTAVPAPAPVPNQGPGAAH